MRKDELGLSFTCWSSVEISNAGLCLAKPGNIHPERTLDTWVLLFVRDGILSVWVETPTQEYRVEKNQVLFLPAGVPHGGTHPYTSPLLFYWLHFYSYPESILSTQYRGKCSPFDTRIPLYQSVLRPYIIVEIFRRILHAQSRGLLTPLVRRVYLLSILTELYAQRYEMNFMEDGPSRLALRAQELIHARYLNPELSREMIARELHCSPDYLGKVFQQTFHLSIVQAIHQRRLEKSIELLLESSLAIREIALRVGFNSDIYFRRVFQRTYCLTPSQFREVYSQCHTNH